MKLYAVTAIAAAWLIPLTFDSTASAEVITFVTQGDITSLDDPDDLTGGATTWTWTHSFDSEAEDQSPDDPTVGRYATLSSGLTIGSLTLGLSGSVVLVRDNHGNGWDGYSVEFIGAPSPDWHEVVVGFSIENHEDLSVVGSDALPLHPPNLSDFPVKLLDFRGMDYEPPLVTGVVTSIERVPCPWDCGMPADGQVSVVDFLALLAQWGTEDDCDFDGGGVSLTDFIELLGNWGPCPTPLQILLQDIRSAIALYNEENPETAYDHGTYLKTFWDPLVQGNYLQAEPINPLTPNPDTNDPTAVWAAPMFGAAWVWAEANPGDSSTLNLYAVNEYGDYYDGNGDGYPD